MVIYLISHCKEIKLENAMFTTFYPTNIHHIIQSKRPLEKNISGLFCKKAECCHPAGSSCNLITMAKVLSLVTMWSFVDKKDIATHRLKSKGGAKSFMWVIFPKTAAYLLQFPQTDIWTNIIHLAKTGQIINSKLFQGSAHCPGHHETNVTRKTTNKSV